MKIYFPLLLITGLLLGACTQSATPTPLPSPTVSSTPDPCASENLKASAQKVNDLQREFDDASELAANLPVAQLPDIISNMQRIRRAAEDQPTPACLATLKTYQLSHMNIVIETLISFVSGANQTVLNDGIMRARQVHDQYTIELARLLGVTLSPTTITPAATSLPGTSSP